MTCSNCETDGAFATVEDFEGMWFYDPGLAGEVELQPLLKFSSGRIRMALRTSGQYDCPKDEDACNYLKEINMTLAAVMSNATCFRLSDEQRRLMAEQVAAQIELIRTGEMEICAGETGKDYPAFGVAQYGTTTRQRATLIMNTELKENT